MELYIDESGNTGCVTSKNGKFNFHNQRHFVLCAIKVNDCNEKQQLLKKYKVFKQKFGVVDEIKGSDLMTKEYNDALKYFIEKILDDKHFEICIYDKKFYLSTLLLMFFLGNEFQTQFPIQFYILAGELTFGKDDLLLEYCELSKKPTRKKFEQFLKNIIQYKFREIPANNNPLILLAKSILETKEYNCWLKDILSYGSYDNPNYVNVINLNCLSELILALKWQTNLSNSSILIYHDKIDGYDKTFISELKQYNINLNFMDSKEDEVIQIADNAVSVFAKCVNQVVSRFEEKKEWDNSSQWIMEQYSKIINKVSIQNIKFTIPMQNWAASLCVKEMFDKKYPKQNRNNLCFNQLYLNYIEKIELDILSKNFDDESILNLLNQ
ncbi:MAG: DUF3800 domain-containing protein [Massilimicrobiota timonensis]